MRAIEVKSPDGTGWTVRVVWRPRWRALARRFGGWRHKRKGGDGAGEGSGGSTGTDAFWYGDIDDILVGIAVFVGLIVFGLLFWWLLLPLLLVLVDILIVLLLAIIAIPARVLLRRPWTVEARAANGTTMTEEIVGWRAALRKRDEMADRLKRGLLDYAR